MFFSKCCKEDLTTDACESTPSQHRRNKIIVQLSFIALSIEHNINWLSRNAYLPE